MRECETVIFSNMCMVYDDKGKILVLNRKDKKWCGIAFPGGHVEKNESFSDAVIREVFEETGLVIKFPQLCGIKQWYESNGTRYVVFCYKTNHFSGNIVSSDEGDLSWVNLDEINKMKLASGMEYMIQLFLNDDISEYCFRKENEQWIDILK